jgi:hypothetical protein
VSHNKNHNHGPNPEEKELSFLRKKMKKLSQKSTLNPSQIINQVTSEASPSLYLNMPSETAMNKIIKRNRKCSNSSEATLKTYVVPEEMKYVKGNIIKHDLMRQILSYKYDF